MSTFDSVIRFFLKLRISLWKIFLILTNSAARKKFFGRLKTRKKQKLSAELEASIRGEIVPKTLWYVSQTATKEDMKQKARQLFLGHKNLWHDDVYNAVDDISSKDNEMINILWNKDLEIGLSDEGLVGIIREGPQNFQDLAYNELLARIKEGITKKPDAEEFLRTIIDKVPNRRIPTWQFLKTLKPSLIVLEKFLESHWLYSLPTIEKEIRELIKKAKKQERVKIETTEKVKKLIKKLQKLE